MKIKGQRVSKNVIDAEAKDQSRLGRNFDRAKNLNKSRFDQLPGRIREANEPELRNLTKKAWGSFLDKALNEYGGGND